MPYQDSYESVDRANPSRSQYPPPRDQYAYSNAGGSQYSSDRPYAPSEPRPHPGNQMAPYDDNKADAEWNRAYTHDRPPPSSRGSYYNNDRYYDDRDRYDEDSDYDQRRSRRRRSRRYSEDDIREKALRYPTDPKKGGRDFFGGSEGDRENGIGPQLLGGAGGAFLGNRFAKGAMGTIGGAVLGAIAAGAVERQYEKRKGEKVYARRDADDPMPVPAGPYPRPGSDMHDVRESAREEERGGFRNRIRSMSRSAKSRVRSLSRGPRGRRSPSVESDERYHYR